MSVFVPYDLNDQIIKDIKRTYSGTKFFNQNMNVGFNKLHRLLIALSDYKKIGYVQGINFIAASLLWHCNEEYAYFILIKLFQRLKIEEIYSENLSMVEKKCNEFFTFVLEGSSNEIYKKLTGLDITPLMILAEWIITLGFSTVPIERHINIVLGLFEKGWTYFYGLLLKYFRKLYPYFKNADFAETLMIIKNNADPNIRKEFGIKLDWDKITEC